MDETHVLSNENKCMSGEIIEKYKELHEACKKYPKINLSSRWEKNQNYIKNKIIIQKMVLLKCFI